jgi:glycogen operon protein
MVAFDYKHNQENGENNRDGTDDNRSWNHGVEGLIMDDTATGVEGASLGLDTIASLRQRSLRNLFATLAFSAGVPMYPAGDEMGRTQWGNNNAYCQDGPTSWVDWSLARWQRDLLDTVRFLFSLRRNHPALRPAAYASGTIGPDGLPDLGWYSFDGHLVNPGHWNDPYFRRVQMLRHSPKFTARDALVLFNGDLESQDCVLAPAKPGTKWELVWDSSWGHPEDKSLADGQEGPDSAPGGATVPCLLLSTRLYLSAPA